VKYCIGYSPAYHPVATVPQRLGDTGELIIIVPAGSKKRIHTDVVLTNGDTLSQ
jgi:hypothetical protein